MGKKRVTLGIDIGGTNTAFGLIDEEGNCINKSSIPTNALDPAEDLFKRLFKNFDEVCTSSSDKYDIKGVGIGAPNANYYSGTIENPPNLNWGTVNVVDQVQKHIDLPVAVTNDANAAALGELHFGVAKGMKNFIQITLGTGLGSGIIADGQLLYGRDGFAGEMGHTTQVCGGRKCACGKRGCLETYVSAPGIKRTVFELLSVYAGKSSLKNVSYEKMTAKDIYDAAVSGDKIARQAFKLTGKYLGEAMANASAYFNPEAFVIFGGLAKSGELIIEPTKKSLERNLLSIYRGKIKILTSGLPEGDAAVVGAAALIWNELMEK